jgi:hypothetical protein
MEMQGWKCKDGKFKDGKFKDGKFKDRNSRMEV